MSQRRYKIGTHPLYDRVLDRHRLGSSILNPEQNRNLEQGSLGDKSNVERLLRELVGSKKGRYRKKKEFGDLRWVRSQTQLLRDKLDYVGAKFDVMNDRRRRAGKLPLQEMPSDLLEEKLRLEATVDVLVEESQELEKILKHLPDPTQDTGRDRMLLYGPICAGHGDPLREIDGQTVTMDEHGTLWIDDEDSPYNDVPVIFYREKISKPWEENRKNKYREKHQEYKAAKTKGLDVEPPSPFGFGTTTVSRSQLPDRPDDEAIEQFMQAHNLIPAEESEEIETETA